MRQVDLLPTAADAAVALLDVRQEPIADSDDPVVDVKDDDDADDEAQDDEAQDAHAGSHDDGQLEPVMILDFDYASFPLYPLFKSFPGP
eukprot:s3507_g8.t1